MDFHVIVFLSLSFLYLLHTVLDTGSLWLTGAQMLKTRTIRPDHPHSLQTQKSWYWNQKICHNKCTLQFQMYNKDVGVLSHDTLCWIAPVVWVSLQKYIFFFFWKIHPFLKIIIFLLKNTLWKSKFQSCWRHRYCGNLKVKCEVQPTNLLTGAGARNASASKNNAFTIEMWD